MSLNDPLSGKKGKGAATTVLRDTLFGDVPLDEWPAGGAASEVWPWGAFVSAREHLAAGREAEAIAQWRQILEQPDLEPRCALQAWHFLRAQGQPPPPDVAKQLLGVVVEVALPGGLDLLAAYPDHSARYYNFSGAGIIWERPDGSLDAIIDQLLDAAVENVAQIGLWEEERPGPPPTGSVRLSFLTPSGLHFGQGPMAVLSRDPLGGRVLQVATGLMQALIATTKAG